MIVAECPSCQSEVKFGSKPFKGQRVRCHRCDEELDVVSLNPITLDWGSDDDSDDGYFDNDYDTEESDYDEYEEDYSKYEDEPASW